MTYVGPQPYIYPEAEMGVKAEKDLIYQIKLKPWIDACILAPLSHFRQIFCFAPAHGTLETYLPAQTVSLDQLRDTSLAAIPNAQAKSDGISGGAAASAAVSNKYVRIWARQA